MNRRAFTTGAVAMAAAVPALGLATRFAPGAAAQDPIVATMVTDTAGLGDQNFNDLANAGGTKAATDFGVEFKVIESTDATAYLPNLTAGAEQGQLTIGVGAFLAGIAAGLMTKTNKVGAVGGQKIPPVVHYLVGFEAGVKCVNAECEVAIGYADTFDDPALGKELALAQYNNGADISMPAAGRTGIGGFEAAKEKGEGFWVIAADTDQDHLAPGFQLGYVKKGVDTTVYKTIGEVVNGAFAPGVQSLGLEAENGISFEDPYGIVTPEVWAVIDTYKAAVIAGTIVVPEDEDQLAAFTPVAPDALPAASPVASPAA
jgi:basic membrane protein A